MSATPRCSPWHCTPSESCYTINHHSHVQFGCPNCPKWHQLDVVSTANVPLSACHCQSATNDKSTARETCLPRMEEMCLH